MSEQDTITDIANVRARAAAVAAMPGMIALENIGGALQKVDDQGAARDISGNVAVADITALSALATSSKYQTGAIAWVASTRQAFVLQAALGTADSQFIVATSDDATKQWVDKNVCGNGVITLFSSLIDFTAAATTTILTPMALHGNALSTLVIIYTAKDGTITTAPTLQAGTNGSNNNHAASQTPAAFTSQAQGTRISITGVSPSLADYDLAATGFRLQVTSGAVLGTATQCKGRAVMTLSLQTTAWTS